MIGEGEYNLNVLTAIETTNSYLELDKEVRKCQNEEHFRTVLAGNTRIRFLGSVVVFLST